MSLPLLQPKKKKNKFQWLVSESKYVLKKIFTRKIRIYKGFSVHVWLATLVILLIIYFQSNHIHGPRQVSTVNNKLPDYSNRKYKDKFDLSYKPVDKRKVSQRWIGTDVDQPFQIGCIEPDLSQNKKQANASLVVLARNKELRDVIKSMSTLERHFNQWFNYPWVFLNDEPFTEKFKKTVKKYTKSKVEFGLVDESMWDFPLTKDSNDSDDEENNEEKTNPKSKSYFNYFEFYEYIERQGDRGIMYGSLDSYHKMCRFYSGGFYRHPLVKQYEWYWRVEPDVQFYCDLTYDPFLEMEQKGKKYGFTVIIKELSNTIPNLFRYTKSFIKENNIKVKNTWNLFVKPLNTFDFSGIENLELIEELKNLEEPDDLILELERKVQINYLIDNMKKESKDSRKVKKSSTDLKYEKTLLTSLVEKTSKAKIPRSPGDVFEGERYNYCHFWSNFEIARVDVWDNPNYNAYFDYLEQSGGFYKERWGDAPIHSLGVGMFMDLSEVHYFRDIGYKHSTIAHCPHNSFDNQLGYAPSENYFKYGDIDRIKREDYNWLNIDSPKKNGVGCRCKCPRKQNEIENTGGSCIADWILATKDAENKKFDNSQRKYSKKLNVKQLLNLITKDYKNFVRLKGVKVKYVSSALQAFKQIRKIEEDENIKFSQDEFDLKLIELTAESVEKLKIEADEEDVMKGIIS